MSDETTEAIINEIVDNFRPAMHLHGNVVFEAGLVACTSEDVIGKLLLTAEEFWALMDLLSRLRNRKLANLIEDCEDGEKGLNCQCPRCRSRKPPVAGK